MSTIPALILLIGGVLVPDDPVSLQRVDAFVEHLAKSEAFETDARQFIVEAWEKRKSQDADRGADEFVIEALSVLSAPFGQAMKLLEDGDAAAAARLFADAARSNDPYLSAYGGIYELKASVESERMDESLTLAEALMGDQRKIERLTSCAAEVHYLLGYCYLRNLDYERARQTLSEFVRQHPGAPERMRAAAQQILAELNARRSGGIGDVADLMDWSAAALGTGRADEKVVGRQEDALELLAKLIDEAKRREQQAGTAADGSSGSVPDAPQNAPQNVPSPASPAQESRLVEGSSPSGPLGEIERARPGEAWGSMPPLERDRILQPIRERFPAHYRELIEQYYLQLSKAGTSRRSADGAAKPRSAEAE